WQPGPRAGSLRPGGGISPSLFDLLEELEGDRSRRTTLALCALLERALDLSRHAHGNGLHELRMDHVSVSVGRNLDRSLLACGRRAEVGARDKVAVAPQLSRRSLVGDAAVLEDVGAVGNLQCGLNELLDEQYGDALVAEHVDHGRAVARWSARGLATSHRAS